MRESDEQIKQLAENNVINGRNEQKDQRDPGVVEYDYTKEFEKASKLLKRELYNTNDPQLDAAAGYKLSDHTDREMVIGKVADVMPAMVRSSKKGLLNSQKEHGSDNQEMVAVKNGIKRIEGMLHSIPGDKMDETLTALYDEYNSTIEKCKDYLKNRNPWSTKGKERKTLVRDNMERLLMERSYFTLAWKKYNDLPADEKERVKRPADVLDSDIIKLSDAEEGRGMIVGERAILEKLKHHNDEPDGEQMREAKKAYYSLVDYMIGNRMPDPEDQQACLHQLEEIKKKYNTAIGRCNDYIEYIRTNNKAKSYGGQVRLEHIEAIHSRLVAQLSLFSDVYNAVGAHTSEKVELTLVYKLLNDKEAYDNYIADRTRYIEKNIQTGQRVKQIFNSENVAEADHQKDIISDADKLGVYKNAVITGTYILSKNKGIEPDVLKTMASSFLKDSDDMKSYEVKYRLNAIEQILSVIASVDLNIFAYDDIHSFIEREDLAELYNVSRLAGVCEPLISSYKSLKKSVSDKTGLLSEKEMELITAKCEFMQNFTERFNKISAFYFKNSTDPLHEEEAKLKYEDDNFTTTEKIRGAYSKKLGGKKDLTLEIASRIQDNFVKDYETFHDKDIKEKERYERTKEQRAECERIGTLIDTATSVNYNKPFELISKFKAVPKTRRKEHKKAAVLAFALKKYANTDDKQLEESIDNFDNLKKVKNKYEEKLMAADLETLFGVIASFDMSKLQYDSIDKLFAGERGEDIYMITWLSWEIDSFMDRYEDMMKKGTYNTSLSKNEFDEIKAKQKCLKSFVPALNAAAEFYALDKKKRFPDDMVEEDYDQFALMSEAEIREKIKKEDLPKNLKNALSIQLNVKHDNPDFPWMKGGDVEAYYESFRKKQNLTGKEDINKIVKSLLEQKKQRIDALSDDKKEVPYYELKIAADQRKVLSERNAFGGLLHQEVRDMHEKMQDDRDRINRLSRKDKAIIEIFNSTNNRAFDEIKQGEQHLDYEFSQDSMNTALRKGIYDPNGGKEADCKNYEHKMNMQNIKKMSDVMDDVGLPNNTVCFKGATFDELYSLLNLSEDKLKEKYHGYSLMSEGEKNEAKMEYLEESIQNINSEKPLVSDKGFMSTSFFYNEDEMSAPVNIFIQAKRGDEALYMDGIVYSSLKFIPYTYKLVFNRDHKFRILKIEKHPDRNDNDLSTPQLDVYLESYIDEQ